jgi:PAS domain S-box-containing protein
MPVPYKSILALFVLSFVPGVARAEIATQTIVVLHSYHQGYEWTDEVNNGIRSVIQARSGYELAFEYLDAQRVSRESIDQLATLLETKYSSRLPSTVIAVDDNALQFLIERREAVFPHVPVVFCGINDLSVYSKASLEGMTGVTESPDISGSLELALQILPATKRIFVLADTTTSGSLNMMRFDKQLSNLPPTLEIIRSIAPEPDELSAEISRLEQGSIVLYLSYLRSAKGRRMTVRESVGFVVEHSAVPVFGCWDFIVEAGAFGGKVVSGRLQGIEAAEKALRINGGKKPDSIPVIAPDSYESVLDYHQLERFKLNQSTLPAGTILRGKPAALPVWAKRGIGILSFVIILEGITLVLVLRGKRMLTMAEKRYRTLAEQLPAIVYSVEFGTVAKTTYASPQLKDMLGYDPDVWMSDPQAWMDAVYPDDRAKVIEEAKLANIEGKPVVFDFRALTRNGEIKYIKNRRAYYKDSGGKQVAIGVWTDVSAEHKIQEHLKSALAEKELLLKEIHHRVKNNFQIVSSLLRLETEQVKNSSAIEALNETERRIFAMSLVHEQLYQYGDFGHISFKAYAQRIGTELKNLVDSRIPVDFSTEGDELSFGLDTAVPLGLFLNEALTNAFKHAFPADFTGERKLSVACSLDEESTTILIRDTGVGFEPSTEQSESLGLTLMNLLASQVGAALKIQSTPGSGTAVVIKIPVKKQ